MSMRIKGCLRFQDKQVGLGLNATYITRVWECLFSEAVCELGDGTEDGILDSVCSPGVCRSPWRRWAFCFCSQLGYRERASEWQRKEEAIFSLLWVMQWNRFKGLGKRCWNLGRKAKGFSFSPARQIRNWAGHWQRLLTLMINCYSFIKCYSIVLYIQIIYILNFPDKPSLFSNYSANTRTSW